ncbi:hypothetical protein [Bacillus cereus]|nr:hypothetical protein [Bacillus cereus]
MEKTNENIVEEQNEEVVAQGNEVEETPGSPDPKTEEVPPIVGEEQDQKEEVNPTEEVDQPGEETEKDQPKPEEKNDIDEKPPWHIEQERDSHAYIREIQMQVHLKSGRGVMLYEDITELEKEEGVTLTEEMLFKEMRETEMSDTIHGRQSNGNIVSIPRDAVDYIEMNIAQRLRDY